MNRMSIVDEGEMTTVHVPRQTVRWNGCLLFAAYLALHFLGMGVVTLAGLVAKLSREWGLVAHDWFLILIVVLLLMAPLLSISIGLFFLRLVLDSGVRETTLHIRRGEIVVVRPRRIRGPLVRRITRSEFLGTMVSGSTRVDGASLVEIPLGTLPPSAKLAEPGEEEPNWPVLHATEEFLTITEACDPEDAMLLSRRIHAAFET